MVTNPLLFSQAATLVPFNDRYRLMTLQQQVELASLLLKQTSGYDRILVVETGASPLALIMQELLKFEPQAIEFFFLKIPREMSVQKLPEHLLFYPHLAEFISKPFLILDEYIDSGHTMNLVRSFLQLLHCPDHYRFLTYMNLCQDRVLKELTLYSCGDSSTKETVFEKGIYPFENRLDYSPYFYHQGKKISLKEFLILDPKTDLDCFEAFQNPAYESFLWQVQEATPLPAVSRFISLHHLILYSLYCREVCAVRKQFFWLLFDMEGPFWTPLSDDYHFSYWKGFEAIDTALRHFLEKEPPFHGREIAHRAASILLGRYEEWLCQIKNFIRSRYDAQESLIS